MTNKILEYFARLLEEYGKNYAASEGIIIADDKIIKIRNGGRQ